MAAGTREEEREVASRAAGSARVDHVVEREVVACLGDWRKEQKRVGQYWVEGKGGGRGGGTNRSSCWDSENERNEDEERSASFEVALS